jgi:hypothetical protein
MERYTPYRAYLVRIWPTKRRGEEGHRATAEDVASGERKDFPDLESLFAFLGTEGDRPTVRTPSMEDDVRPSLNRSHPS